jgi:sugar phosphate isomerase/epimerase
MSNIAWSAEHDAEMFSFLRDSGFAGLEIAPTRIFPENPYRHIAEARRFAIELHENHGLAISSMQSIWYGRNENIFGSRREREILIDYTKQAIDFAAAVGCGNLVFGCPKNRNIPAGATNYENIAIDFFSRIAEYAAANGTIIALEPNPPIYGTNFINTTQQAVDFCKKSDNKGLKVNIDIGTMIATGESVLLVGENLNAINHIHISEPKLLPIERRKIHDDILALPFNRYASIEMGDCGDIEKVKQTIEYIKNLL